MGDRRPAASGQPTLEALMERYVDGDAAAFEQVHRLLSPRLFGYLLRLTRHRERAEDLLQITFAKIHRARASYLTGAAVTPWAFAIARRSFYDERRAARVRPEDLSHDGLLPEPARVETGVPDDVSEALERALDGLPGSYREAIQLTKLSGLSVSEAASVLGTTATAVKIRVHRGYNLLRESLDAYNRRRS